MKQNDRNERNLVFAWFQFMMNAFNTLTCLCERMYLSVTQQRKQRRRRQRERNKSMKRRRRRSDRTLYIHEGKNSVRVRKLRLQLRKKCDANSVVHVRNRDNAIDRMLRTLQTHSSNDFSDEDTLLARNVRILYSE